jgi:hypothetical protein
MPTKSALLRVDKSHARMPAAIKQLDRLGFVISSIRRNRDPLPDRPGDPMITDHIATNDGELSLIRRYRRSIHERLNYEWVRGRLVPAGFSIAVRENDITNEMKQLFSWRLAEPLSDEKVALFVKLYQAVAKNLDPDRIKICGHAYAKGLVDYGRLEISAKQELLERCKSSFSAAEIEELSRFIESQRDGDGVMTLRVTNLYTIEESQTG